MKQYYIYLAIIAVAMMCYAVPAPAQSVWRKVYSTMHYADSVYVGSPNGADATKRYLATTFNGEMGDTLIVARKYDKAILFHRYMSLYLQVFSSSNARVRVYLNHGDTTVSYQPLLAAGDYNPWFMVTLDTLSGTWFGNVSAFDSVWIVEEYNPGVNNIAPMEVDFDQFSNGDTVFDDGGEKTVIGGLVFFDRNQNGIHDSTEFALGGWHLYVSGTTTDTLTSNGQGKFLSQPLPRGSYVLMSEQRDGWTTTTAETLSVDAETDTVTVPDVGKYAPQVTIIQVAAHWNMVSLPLNPPDPSVVKVFPGASSNAFGYTGSGYDIVNQLQVGNGYWLKFPSAETLAVKGDSLQADTVSVSDGWNMVGAISVPVAVNAIGSIPGGLVTSQIFRYEQSYKVSDTLVPGNGYWIKTKEAGQLIINSHNNIPQATRIKITPDEELPPPLPGTGNSIAETHPKTFALEQNYPNPFNPTTTVRYSIAKPSHVLLRVYDVLGSEVQTLVNEDQSAGEKMVRINAGNLASGLYFYKISAGSFIEVKKMVVLK